MFSVKLTGGLGNQMFVYAFAKALEQKGFPIYLSTYEYTTTQNQSIVSCSSKNTNNPPPPPNIPTNHSPYGIRNAEIFFFDLTLPSDLDFENNPQKDSPQPKESQIKKSQPIQPLIIRMIKNLLKEQCSDAIQCIKQTKISPQKNSGIKARILQFLKRGYYSKFAKVISEGDPILFDIFQDTSLLSLINPNAHFLGYFQDLKFFDHIREILLHDFTIKKPLSHDNQILKNQIINTPNSCFLHIRRGDYLLEGSWTFLELGSTYYENAIKTIKHHTIKPTIFIFSNEIQWCRENFLQRLSPEIIDGINFYFVQNNDEGNAAEEMELMKACQHGIIANSTFSWWAAYLIPNASKIIITPTHFHHYESITEKLIPTDLSKNGKWIAVNHNWRTP